MTRIEEINTIKASEIGTAIHTPFKPIRKGSIITIGTNKITCRVINKKLAMFPFPIDWKSTTGSTKKP